MDPFSAVVNIVTLLGAGGAIMHAMGKVLALGQAPETVLALNNEMSDLRLVSMEIHEFLQDYQRSASQDHRSETIKSTGYLIYLPFWFSSCKTSR